MSGLVERVSFFLDWTDVGDLVGDWAWENVGGED